MEMLDSPLSLEPRYRINAVSEMTGLSAPNLRAWERRYGIPNPQRADNAYRLYSNRDVMILRKMKALCDAGHAPSDASKIALSEIDARRDADLTPIGFIETRDLLIKATEELQPARVEQLIAQSFSLGSAWEIYHHILEPALIHIGELWERDPQYVAHEHMLAQSVKGALNQLLRMIQPPAPRKRLIFACVAHEQHDIPLYALAIRASHAGCLPIILGANTPPEAIKNAVVNLNPDGVALSATTTLITAPLRANQEEAREEIISSHELIDSLEAYREACGDVPWLIGGRSTLSWPELADHLRPVVVSSYLDLDILVT